MGMRPHNAEMDWIMYCEFGMEGRTYLKHARNIECVMQRTKQSML